MSENKSIQVSKSGQMQITTIEEAYRQASLYHKSGLVPASFDSPEKIMVGLQMAIELKLPPLTALKSMYVLKGVASLFGDLPLSLVMQSGLLEWIKEVQLDKDRKEICSKNNNLGAECEMAICVVKRKGYPDDVERSYSWSEAKAAGLDKGKFGDKDTWVKHRRRMLQMRSRSWALKDVFPDVLMGVAIREYGDAEDFEARDVANQTFKISEPEQITVSVEEAFDIPQSAQATIPENVETVRSEPPELDQSEQIDDDIVDAGFKEYPQIKESVAEDQVTVDYVNKADDQGFIQDAEKPFIKTKAKTLNETLKDRAGDVTVLCWKKFEGSKVRDLPEDELLTMLANLDLKIKTKTEFPSDWQLFYSSACTFLNRKQESI